jgi:hypothetical protein
VNLRRFASIKLTVFCLLWLAVLTFWGTIYQVDNGIYLAQDRFFNSILFFGFGFLPLPGGMLVLATLFVNLIGSFIYHYQAGWKMPGLMLIHIGLIMMLLGGFFTRISGIEARVQLFEGQGTNTAFDVKQWEISMTTQLEAVRDIQAIHLNEIGKRDWFEFGENTGVKYTVQEVHLNAEGISKADVSEEEAANFPTSPSGFHAIQPLDKDKDPTKNIPAVRLKVEGAKNVKDVIIWGNDPRPVGIEREDGTVAFLKLRRQRYELPMFIELLDFTHEYYPGSRVPKDFRSKIIVHLGEDAQRNVEISMNNPFRQYGWTFYQHKFNADENSEMSELAVTRNFGRLIPYWATGITSVGLALHFLQMQLMQLKRRRKRA